MWFIKQLIGKVVYGVFVLILVCILVTSIIFMGEVDPTRLSFGQRVDESTIEAQQKELGLDNSLLIQIQDYFCAITPIYLGSKQRGYKGFEIIEGDNFIFLLKKPYLRRSFQSGRLVNEIIGEAFPVTLLLALTSFIIALIFGLLFGILASKNYNTWIDHTIVAFSTLGYSLPSYVVAIFFAILFAYFLYPITGLNLQGSIFEINEIGDDIIVLKNLILPALALGVRPLSVITQITRASVLDVIQQPYVRTAVAKGIPTSQLWKKHILLNTLVPIGTATTGWLASLLAGAFFVETVFNFRGLGSVTVEALLNYDIPLVLACILFTSILFILINILTDIFYILVNPKMRT